jgi:hypothetical protein
MVTSSPTRQNCRKRPVLWGVQLQILQARSDEDLKTAYESLVRPGAAGIVIGSDPFFNSRAEQLGALSALHAVPAIYESPSSPPERPSKPSLLGAYTGRALHGDDRLPAGGRRLMARAASTSTLRRAQPMIFKLP